MRTNIKKDLRIWGFDDDGVLLWDFGIAGSWKEVIEIIGYGCIQVITVVEC